MVLSAVSVSLSAPATVPPHPDTPPGWQAPVLGSSAARLPRSRGWHIKGFSYAHSPWRSHPRCHRDRRRDAGIRDISRARIPAEQGNHRHDLVRGSECQPARWDAGEVAGWLERNLELRGTLFCVQCAGFGESGWCCWRRCLLPLCPVALRLPSRAATGCWPWRRGTAGGSFWSAPTAAARGASASTCALRRCGRVGRRTAARLCSPTRRSGSSTPMARA